MRKQGKKGHGTLSVYEKVKLQREAQARRREARAKQEEKERAAAGTANQCLDLQGGKENVKVPAKRLPRKSENQTSNGDVQHGVSAPLRTGNQQKIPSKDQNKSKIADQQKSGDTEHSIEIVFTDDDSQVEPRKSPKKTADGKPDSRGTSQARASARKISPQKTAKSASDSEDCMASLSNEAPLAPLSSEILRECLPKAVKMVRERVLDIRGGVSLPMTLRPALRVLQDQLEKMLRTTIDIPGENSSVLVVGPRGVGKTLVIERTAVALEAAYNTDKTNPSIAFVRLTGLLHTEERSAFKEIARQLCKSFNCSFSKTASFEDNLGFLRDMLKELRRAHKVVVFILEEFDMFARKPKQTLLYNLLDAMQAADMQAAVIGVSCRSDVTEMLEKRVKSRFSYRRSLVLDTCSSDVQNSEDGAIALLSEMLRVPEGAKELDVNFVRHFNRAVGEALRNDSVVAIIRSLCFKGLACPRELGLIAVQALSKAGFSTSLLQPSQLLTSCQAADTEQNAQMDAVRSLSVLEAFLLVAFARLRRKGRETQNFEMAFDEYSGLRRGGSYRGVDDTAAKPLAFRAFERLISAALISFTDSRASMKAGLREFLPTCLLLTQHELEQGIRSSQSFPSVLMEWLKKDSLVSYAAENASAVI